ncbi:PPC domain-containing protein [Crateriforma conspicua]|uniref:Peptidase C-terminal archaeal/bacterial domain-containing protein n=1 Tax=Crateriforma conspicua TaxID=2527996 RepID=A0A5C6FY60_9PLAN|nr:PPC domain-containing protein [Crateriforma conspicua]TWU65963.1 hypothetical protein V7x_15190 [Crateriforma conspicua]
MKMNAFSVGRPNGVTGIGVARNRAVRTVVACVVFVCLQTVASVRASYPVVERLQPMGVRAGTETKLTFHGQRLGDTYDVVSDDPRIEIIDVKAVDGKKADVTLKVAESVSPGLYPLRLVTKTGVANLRLLSVGHLPVVTEAEPNSRPDQAQSVPINHTIEGVVDTEDVDLFNVDVAAGQRLTVEVEGIRLAFSLRNQNILDPYVAILDSEGIEVASSDDSALLQQDGLCTYTPDQAGTYTVMIRDSSFRGSRVSGYRLHIGDFPRPMAIFPAGGQPGSVLQAQWIDVDGSVHEDQFQLPSLTDDHHRLWVKTDKGISPSPNTVRVNDLPVHVETEPNDDIRKAPEFTLPAAFCGIVDKENDFDCFSFQCKKGRRYRVEVFARHALRSSLDAVLNVFGPDNRTIQSSDDVAGRMDPSLEFAAKEDGKHTIRIYDHLRLGTPTHQYRVEVVEATAEVNLTLKELRRDEATPALVPAGGHGAIMVTAARTNYGGPIGIDIPSLPDGVTATTFDVPAGRGEIPVLLSAKAGTDPICQPISLTGIAKDPKALNVGSRFVQTHKLVLGQNRRHMWATDTPHALCAVVEPTPFEIELVQPKTPIVRQGSANLVVRVKRNDGFKEQIALRTLYNPPGVGVNNSRRIAGDKSEALIPITANSRAATGQWPMILMATFTAPGGSQVIATNAIDLQVENEYFKYAFPKAATEQGKSMTYAVNVEVLREFDDEAEIELVGLPNGVTSPKAVQPLTKDSTVVNFPLEIAADAKVGKHRTLVCVARLKRSGEVITQTTGTGELRIDKTMVAAPAKKPEKPAAKKAAEPKPLSRLEQLRQKRQEMK